MKTIIVVDDDAIFRSVIKMQLNRIGFSVIEKESGKGVAEEIEKVQPVACIIDIFMDEKEGIETILEVSNLPMRPKIIAVSSSNFYLNIANDLGADASLKKPVSLQSLEETLSEMNILKD